MPATRKPRKTVAQKLGNPAWRATISDADLRRASPEQYKRRLRSRALASDPLAPVTTLGGLEQQAGTLVDTQQAGDTAAIKADQDRADATFRTRSGLYQGLSNMQTAGAKQAFDDVTKAINNVITATNAGTSADAAQLGAALKASDDAQRAAYASMGVAPADPAQANLPGQVPQDTTAARLAALAGTSQGVQQQVGQSGIATLGAESGMSAIPGQNLDINLRNLTGEQNQTNKELSDRRATLTQQRHGLLRQAVRDLQDFEVAKRTYGDQHANMLFQQYLAQKEFDEKVKQESFAEWLQTAQLTGVTPPGGPIPAGQQTLGGAAQDVATAGVTGTFHGQETLEAKTARLTRKIDWYNAHTSRTQANAAILQALKDAESTTDDKKKKELEAKAARLAKGITALNSFLAPTAGEGAPPASTSRYPVGTSTSTTDDKGNQVTHSATQEEADAYNKAHPDNPNMIAGDPVPTQGKPYVRRFNDALAYLKSQGLSHSDALRILSMSTYTDWHTKARGMLSRMKRRQKGENAPEPKPPKKPKKKPGQYIPGGGPTFNP